MSHSCSVDITLGSRPSAASSPASPSSRRKRISGGFKRSLAEAFPETDRDVGVDVVSLKATTVGSVRGSLWLIFGAVSVLLLIACTNIAALLLARAAERQPQFAVRLALGASKASLARQMLTETAILALVGAVLGLLVATGVTFGFRALAPNFPRLDDIALSGTTLAFTATLVVA